MSQRVMSNNNALIQDFNWSIDPTAPVRGQIYEGVRNAIIRGEIKPGTSLSEADIARRLSVSRQPVREAFLKLAEDGLLEVRPQRGSFVQKISIASVMDARFVREAIEARIVRQLASSHDKALIKQLRKLLTAQKAVPRSRLEDFMKLDEEFHKTLINSECSLYGWKVIEAIKIQIDRVRYLTLQKFPQENLIRQHTAIVDAIEQGLPDKAENEMQKHLQLILEDLPGIEKEHPDFFIF